jgi:tetratricopeptide (TPR) repeat protein
VLAFFRIIGQKDVPLEDLKDTLIQIANSYKEVEEKIVDITPKESNALKSILLAKDKLKEGGFASADQYLQESVEWERLAARKPPPPGEDASRWANQHLLTAAAILAVRGQIALMRLRYDDAAVRFEEAASLVPNTEDDDFADTRGAYILEEADAYRLHGMDNGPRNSLEKAVELYRSVLNSENIVKIERFAEGQANLGDTLIKLTENNNDTTQMDEAMAAYKLALNEKAIPLEPAERVQALFGLGATLMNRIARRKR